MAKMTENVLNLNKKKRSWDFQIFFFNTCILNEQYLPNFALYFVSMRWSKCFSNIAGQAEANQWFPWGRSWGRGVGSELHHFGQATEKAVSCELKYQMQIPSWCKLSQLPWSWWICWHFLNSKLSNFCRELRLQRTDRTTHKKGKLDSRMYLVKNFG